MSACALAAGQTPAQAVQPAPFTVVASHLANPRGLAFSRDSTRTLYVVEAGLGAGTEATGVQVGTGQTGRVLSIADPGGAAPTATTLQKNLWSQTTSGPRGFETLGPAGITTRRDEVFLVMSESYTPGLGPQPQEGQLLHLKAGKAPKAVAGIAAADLAWEAIPANAALDPQFPDTNPYGVTNVGDRLYVVDAGSNTLDEVGPGAAVRVIAYLPNTPLSDAVPTCVTQGPDGALYIGTLAIADGPGAAKIYRVDPHTTAPATSAATVWATGLSTVNGCAFSPDGRYFYASEFIALETLHGPPVGPPPGAVIRIPFSKPASHTYLALGALNFPGGIAVSRNGSVFVTNWSNQGAGARIGQVVRLNQ